MQCPNAFVALKVPQFNKHISRTRNYKQALLYYTGWCIKNVPKCGAKLKNT